MLALGLAVLTRLLVRAFVTFSSVLAVVTFSTSALVLEDRPESFTKFDELGTTIHHFELQVERPFRLEETASEWGIVTSLHVLCMTKSYTLRK